MPPKEATPSSSNSAPTVPQDFLPVGPVPQSVSEAGSSSVGKSSGSGEDRDEDNMESKLWVPFMSRTNTGFVNLQDLLSIAEELGIDCDQGLLEKLIKEENREEIYFEEAANCMSVLLRATHEDLMALTTEKKGDDIVKLSPWEYIAYKFNCYMPEKLEERKRKDQLELSDEDRLAQKDYEPPYEVDMGLCMSAKFQLLLVTFILFVGASAGIISFSAVTWLDKAIAREKEHLGSLQEAMVLFCDAFQGRFLNAHAALIGDAAGAIGVLVEQNWEARLADKLITSEEESLMLMHVLEEHADRSREMTRQDLGDRVAALNGYIPHINNIDVAAVRRVVAGWKTQSPWDLQLNDTVTGLSISAFARVDAAGLAPYCRQALLGIAVSGGTSALVHVASLNATILAAKLPGISATVCGVLWDSVLEERAMQAAAKALETSNALPMDAEFIRPQATLWRSVTNTTAITKNGLWIKTDRCKLQNVDCQSFHSWVYNMTKYRTTVVSTVRKYYDGEDALVTGRYVPQLDAVLVLGIVFDNVIAAFRNRLLDTVNIANFKYTRVLEVVLGGVDTATGRIIPQINSMKNEAKCLGGICNRFAEASESSYLAMRTSSSGYIIAPDYRPRPTVSAYAKVTGDVNRPLLLERGTTSLRLAILDNLVAAINEINKASNSDNEIQLVRWDDYEVGFYFDPQESCPDNTYCIQRRIDGNLRLIFRTDCVDCLDRPILAKNATFAYKTVLKFGDRCPAYCNDNKALQTKQAQLAKAALALEKLATEDKVTLQQNDYTGEKCIAVLSYVHSMATAVLVKAYEKSIRDPVMVAIIVCLCIACALTFLGIVLILLFTQRTLQKIDDDWRVNKAQIDEEKQKFATFVQHLLPRHVMKKYDRGYALVAELSPAANVCIIDICGFSELTRGWTAKQYFRFSNYYFRVLDEVAAMYGIFKLKTFGDIFVCISAIGKSRLDQFVRVEEAVAANKEGAESGAAGVSPSEDGKKHAGGGAADHSEKTKTSSHTANSHTSNTSAVNAASQPPILNMAQMTVVVLQVMSDEYSHRPSESGGINTRPLSDQDDADLMTMPQLRIGLHVGPFVAGYVDMGGTPKFDCYGSTMLVANRMQLTCPPNRVHMSSHFREELELADVGSSFEYEQQRKTIVRGRVTVSSYLVRTANVAVPEHFVGKLKITHAHHPHLYISADEAQAGTNTGTKSDTVSFASSQRSGTSHNSNRRK